MVHCGYRILTLSFQCTYACSYCFLRFYAPDAPLTVYANLEDAGTEFERACSGWSQGTRVGTGEFTDSLVLDPWTEHSRWLRNLAARHPGVTFELKTKSKAVELLLEDGPWENLVIAWSLNPESLAGKEELGAVSLAERLEAAALVAGVGYRVAFHFDPVILHQGWRVEYDAVVRSLFEAVDPSRVAWVSLGTLRFPARFLERWGRSLAGRRHFFHEFIAGEDGKLRYFWPLRKDAYRHLAQILRKWGGDDLPLYLCMESPAMWEAALRWTPAPGQVEGLLCARQPCLAGCCSEQEDPAVLAVRSRRAPP
jgi:spore photoproduct lyase